jgi:hypothetical protein
MVMATGLQLNLNRVIGRTSPDTYLDAQGAANVWAKVPPIASVHTATTATTAGIYAAGPDPANPGIGATITAPTNGTLTVDGHLMLLGERTLYWLNTDAKTNGIYVVTNAGSASTKWVFTRATDADRGYDLSNGSYVTVSSGTDYAGTNRGKTFVLTNTGTGPNGSIVFGTDNITFAVSTAGIASSIELLNSNLVTGTDTLAGLTGIGVYNGTSPNVYATTTSLEYSLSGNRSIKLTPDAGAVTITSMTVGTVGISSVYLPAIKPNTTYTLSFHTRTAVPLSNTVSLVAVPQATAGTSLTPITIASSTAISSDGWTKITGQFTTSSSHNYLVLRAVITGTNLVDQNYYFDNFSMKETTPVGDNFYDLLGALNIKAGTNGIGLNRVCNIIANTTNLDADGASEYFI